jgi:hypothetical protein
MCSVATVRAKAFLAPVLPLFRGNIDFSNRIKVVSVLVHLVIINLENFFVSETTSTVGTVLHGVVEIAYRVSLVSVVELLEIFLVKRSIQANWDACIYLIVGLN